MVSLHLSFSTGLDNDEPLWSMANWYRRGDLAGCSVDAGHGIISRITDECESAVPPKDDPIGVSADVDLCYSLERRQLEHVDCIAGHAGAVQFTLVRRQRQPVSICVEKGLRCPRGQRRKLDRLDYLSRMQVDDDEPV